VSAAGRAVAMAEAGPGGWGEGEEMKRAVPVAPPSSPSFLSFSSNGCGLARGTSGRRQEASALWAEREARQIVAAV
jgi:hypothetical protein